MKKLPKEILIGRADKKVTPACTPGGIIVGMEVVIESEKLGTIIQVVSLPSRKTSRSFRQGR